MTQYTCDSFGRTQEEGEMWDSWACFGGGERDPRSS
jgi:hypothetical protein